MIEQPTLRPRTWLGVIRARYDGGAVPQGMWKVIKDLEAHEAWRNHIDWARRGSPRHLNLVSPTAQENANAKEG
jgi:hypothetical protein